MFLEIANGLGQGPLLVMARRARNCQGQYGRRRRPRHIVLVSLRASFLTSRG